MSLTEVLALALVQGLTEFIPVSSSGHLLLTERFFGGPSAETLPYLLLLHLATAAAAVR